MSRAVHYFFNNYGKSSRTAKSLVRIKILILIANKERTFLTAHAAADLFLAFHAIFIFLLS